MLRVQIDILTSVMGGLVDDDDDDDDEGETETGGMEVK
jgi:hypothetical protein